MIKRIFGALLPLTLLLLSIPPANQAQDITHIYTSFGEGWSSGADNLNEVPTNDDSFLLGFTVGGTTYSTGVDDVLLETLHGSDFVSAEYHALPVEDLAASTSGTYIGIPYLWEGTPQLGGGSNSGYQTLPVEQVSYYINEGTQGLNLGTAVFNIAAGSTAEYPIESINSEAISNPHAPAIIVTQMGQPGTVDNFKFTDAAGNTIGNEVEVLLGEIEPVGEHVWAFFDPHTFQYSPSQPGGTGGSGPHENTRDTRLRIFNLADFGLDNITPAELEQIVNFVHVPGG